MKKILILVFSLGLPCNALAEKLMPDAVLCDNKDDLEVLEKQHLKGLSAEKVFEKVKAEIEFNSLLSKAHQIQMDAAVQEEQIRNMGNLRGSTAGQVTALQEEQRKNEAATQKLKSFLKSCISSGASTQVIAIVERKAVAGLVKVQASVNGAQAQVWKKFEFLSQ